jgi:hypothetical protein
MVTNYSKVIFPFTPNTAQNIQRTRGGLRGTATKRCRNGRRAEAKGEGYTQAKGEGCKNEAYDSGFNERAGKRVTGGA